MDNNAPSECTFEESLSIAKKHNTKLVWLGREPAEYISELLGLHEGDIIKAEPSDFLSSSGEQLKRFENSVLVCYHGNTSMYVAKFLKQKHNITSYSMKGGVTAITGEIF
ncbi:MAG: rhodanese-like domain-containing protein [Candidatus Marsarchaeota archaeon]|jgi:rhodanese-related sulfurtransferase|nr:rhodanese-like domain-containing protein [Candidatus Marsarchaeota archaeon]